jgi:hypothetical protein
MNRIFVKKPETAGAVQNLLKNRPALMHFFEDAGRPNALCHSP